MCIRDRANKARSEDARLKLRLGGFLFLLDWQDLELDILSDRIQKIAADLTEIDSETQERFKILGENTLRLLVRDREYDPASPGLSSDDRRKLNHQKITLGGLLVKYDLHKIERSVLFGALLDFNQPRNAKRTQTKKRARKPSTKRSSPVKTR